MKALKDEVPCLDEFVENLDECGRIKFESPRRLSEVGEGTIYLLVWGSLLGFGQQRRDYILFFKVKIRCLKQAC